MNRQAEDLGEPLLDAIFETSSDVVDLGNRQAAVHRAVAGDENLVVHATNVHIVAILQFVVIRLK